MGYTDLELADRILKSYEYWARDFVTQGHCYSAESRYVGRRVGLTETVQAEPPMILKEEALDCCRQVMATLSKPMREDLLSQYPGLQGYYRRKLYPKQRVRARGAAFDNVLWQISVELALLVFIGRLRKQAGEGFRRYFGIS